MKPLPALDSAEIDRRIELYVVEGDSPKRDIAADHMFAPGDTVTAGNPPSVEHTRLPGFLRNKTGTVKTVYPGAYTYLCETGPDGLGEAMPVYCVRFDPQVLWPNNAERNFTLYADLYAAYLAAQ